ncbi:MAG TPA: prolyl oligopeptidase family serine peptidase, partial [Isosphaeraceae bacterium]|nr:prolyl oligopeptidase family serine peptidase [Isosphaeraceae bacterium]
YVHIPVALRQGSNEFLFARARGALRAKLVEPRAEVTLDSSDTTLPDLVAGETEAVWGALVAINATPQAQQALRLEASFYGSQPEITDLPRLLEVSFRKVGFRIPAIAPVTKPGDVKLDVKLARKVGDTWETLDTTRLSLRVRQPSDSHKRTFVSKIDNSVQYYAVNPAQELVPGAPASRPRALFLTLHGAAVEAIGQADAYEAKSWGHLVAPTNRRPYGFDWEDWGRLDALEVLSLAQERLGTDASRTYLTGHSMGGHGVWHLGATYPDRFAAIGPSAAWVSMISYAGASQPDDASAVSAILKRAASASDTLALAHTYAQHGVYILHGDADDNVPVREARTMKQKLAEFHSDFAVHEQPGAGHWWDDSDEPGASCVDWPPMFDFFARHQIPSDESVRTVDFTTASPGVSAHCHWLTIEAQTQQGDLSSAHIRLDPGKRRFVGQTENVARLALDLNSLSPGAPVRVELDGQKIDDISWPAAKPRLWLARESSTWAPTPEPSPALKGPHRYGPFKDAFRNRVIFVYGTHGSDEENAWSQAKARFDAELFWYQGNASIDIYSDNEFPASNDRDRNVIVYGHRECNAAWNALLAESPVVVARGELRIGQRTLRADNLACLFLRPRPGSDRATVGVVAGTGSPGARLTDRLPYFTSGVAYPDCLVLEPSTLERGIAGAVCAGFFGLDWSVEKG